MEPDQTTADGGAVVLSRPATGPKRPNSGGKRSGRPAASGAQAPEIVEGLEARLVASRLLAAVVDRHTPLDALTDDENGNPAYLALDRRDRSLVRAILLAALRHRRSLTALIDGLLDRPLPSGARALEHLLHVGAVQIVHLDVPDSAAVNLAVTQAKSDPRNGRFAGVVNAILRNIARLGRERAIERTTGVLEAPDWFAERLVADYGAERAAAITRRHAMEAPIDLTVKSDPEGWADRLGGIVLPTGTVRLTGPSGPIHELDGFSDGQWWVQDAGAALPARLLTSPSGRSIGDLCAAPGGKTAQLICAGATLTAVDISANRLKRLQGNLDRLDLSARTHAADLRKWEPDEPFDAVLLDAPCSSTGTVRRHPDVPWTKTPDDVTRLAALQAELLERARSFVRPGGQLVFANCSLLREEGEAVAEAFAARHDDVAVDPIEAEEVPGLDGAITPEGFLRTTPADLPPPPDREDRLGGVDGFFAARFRIGG